jgi:hypothetical protein
MMRMEDQSRLEEQIATARRGGRARGGCAPADSTGRCYLGESNAVFVSNPDHEKLLDDTEALLYCDHEFDHQFALSLS